MIAAVIFDMDGVLIDSNPTHAAAWLEYLGALGLLFEGIDTWMAGKRNGQNTPSLPRWRAGSRQPGKSLPGKLWK